MKLIVGLGNPGKKYADSRHNTGFKVLDVLAKELSIDVSKEDFLGVYGRGRFLEEDILLLKPMTFMNLSGQSVQALAAFFKINPEDILVVFDDMAIPPGKIRLRLSGSSGGQKGMQNIIEMLGTSAIKRIRVGIGEPENKDAIDYVLGKPSAEEKTLVDEAIVQASKAILDALKNGFHHAMSTFN